MPAKTPEEALYAKLVSLTALAAVVGERITPGLGTQEPVYPLVTYERFGADATSGLSQSAGRPTRYLMNVSIYARNEADLAAAGTAIVGDGLTGLQNWRDLDQGVQGCFHTDSSSDPGDGEVRKLTHTFALFFRKPT
jgi:hypothetical protein